MRNDPSAFADHSRAWADNLYVYPVLSRRSGGLSVGVNLNPDTACNFDCVYCQVDRSGPPRVRDVDLEVLERELDDMLRRTIDGSLFRHPRFAAAPPDLRRCNDIAFSGDGEPTACPVFAAAVRIAAERKRAHRLDDVKIVLITDACYLARPEVIEGLAVMDGNQGEIWAKLDAGTEAHFQTVNRPNYPLSHVLANIVHAARVRPVVIQSLWMRLHGAPPPEGEIAAYIERLREITDAGGRVSRVQLYTVARRPAEPFVTPLPDEELDAISVAVKSATALHVTTHHSGP